MRIEQTQTLAGPVGTLVRRTPGGASGGWSGALRKAGLLLIVAFFFFPIIYLGIISLKSQDDVLSGRLLPSRLAFENWPNAYAAQPVLLFLRNSALVALGSAALTMLIAVPAAYAMARFAIVGRRLHSFVLSSYMAPPIVAVIPLFFLLRWIGLINSLPGLTLIYAIANMPVAIWLLDSFMRDLPIEIEEAARVDGAGIKIILLQIVVPLIAPGIVAAGIISLILAYNEFLFALILTYGPEAQTLPVGVALFQGDRLVQFGQMAAVSLTAIAPVYLVALFFQRWLIQGLTSGSIK